MRSCPGVRGAAALLGALYTVLAGFPLVAAPEGTRVALCAAALATAAVAWVIHFLTRWDGLPPQRAAHLGGGLAALAAGNSLLHVALTNDPVQVTNVMLVLVGACAVVDHRWWTGAVGSGSVAGVAWVEVTVPPDPVWVHFGFGLLSALLLGVVLRVVRQRGLASLDRAGAAAAAAIHDALTGLLNRRGLDLVSEQVLCSARRDGRTVGVLFVDIDGLKAVNDTPGHTAGDALIVEARLLRDAFREADAVARLGGDEFAVLVEGVRDQDAALLVERASRALSRTPASVGIAVAPDARAVSLSRLYAIKRGARPLIGVAGEACHWTVRQSTPVARSRRSR